MNDIYVLADAMIQRRIGEKLKAVRLKQNITQQSLAESAEVSLSTVKKIESGEIGSFASRCAFCGYSASWIRSNLWSRRSN